VVRDEELAEDGRLRLWRVQLGSVVLVVRKFSCALFFVWKRVVVVFCIIRQQQGGGYSNAKLIAKQISDLNDFTALNGHPFASRHLVSFLTVFSSSFVSPVRITRAGPTGGRTQRGCSCFSHLACAPFFSFYCRSRGHFVILTFC